VFSRLDSENIVSWYLLFYISAFGKESSSMKLSTSNEFTILVSEEQVDVAFKVIKDLKN
jgi:hypothetical protein